MKPKTAIAVGADRPRYDLSKEDIKDLLLPILKRVPAYVRLGWALLREPAIPRRHKALLYSTIVYTFSPLHLMVSPIPVVAQVDSVVLLLLGIRQAMAHCPEEIIEQHLARLKVPSRQMEKDLNVGVAVAWRTLGRIGRPIGTNARFAGRVAGGFGRRMLQRLLRPGVTSGPEGPGGPVR